MTKLEEKDATLAFAFKNQTESQQAKLEARKAHLGARKLAKAKVDTDEAIVKQKIPLAEEEQQAKFKITEEYIITKKKHHSNAISDLNFTTHDLVHLF